jgi:hypothetical protein
MPVLTTIAAVSYLFGRSKEKTSFLDPVGLRKKIQKLPEGSTRTSAIALVDRLDTLAKAHEAATDSAINAYIADVEKYTTSTDQLVADFEPLDLARTKVYRELVEVRQAMVETLSAKEWDKVFGWSLV